MQSITASADVLPVPALAAAFATIPDPRGARGKRFSLVAMLNLAVAAMLANHLSELAIAEWGAAQSPPILHALGFVRGVTPHQTTVQRLFRTLDPVSLARALTTCFGDAAPARRGTHRRTPPLPQYPSRSRPRPLRPPPRIRISPVPGVGCVLVPARPVVWLPACSSHVLFRGTEPAILLPYGAEERTRGMLNCEGCTETPIYPVPGPRCRCNWVDR